MNLNDTKIRALAKPGRYFDGHGLYLEITAQGGRYWRMKYRRPASGKESRLAFGTYPALSLRDARELASNARKALALGRDPGTERKAAKAQAAHDAANTLAVVGREWLTHMKAKWTERTYLRNSAAIERDIFKLLGTRPLVMLTPRDVIAMCRAIEARGACEQAHRSLHWTKAVCSYAVVHGRIKSNPIADLMPSNFLQPHEKKPRAMLPERELSAFLQKLDGYGREPETVNAMRLLVLTATRSEEVRGARWAEIDLEAATWTIPAERMKMRREHRVPLSTQAVAVLRDMQAISGERGGLVFPSPYYPGKGLSENTFNSMLAYMGYKGVATAHGFRALFSTVANESGLWNADAIERQLAHKELNEVRAAYHRSTYLPERTRMMQWWADLLDAKASGGKVLAFKLPGERAA